MHYPQTCSPHTGTTVTYKRCFTRSLMIFIWHGSSTSSGGGSSGSGGSGGGSSAGSGSSINRETGNKPQQPFRLIQQLFSYLPVANSALARAACMSFHRHAPGMPGWLPIGSWVQVAGYGFSIPPPRAEATLPGPIGDARNLRIMYLAVCDSSGRPRLFVQVAVLGFFQGPELVLRSI